MVDPGGHWLGLDVPSTGTAYAAVWALRKLYSRAKAVVIYAFYENRDTPGHLRLDLHLNLTVI